MGVRLLDPLGGLLGARLGPCLILLSPDIPSPCSGSPPIGLLIIASRSLSVPPSIEKRICGLGWLLS